jgi:predicted transcriptional regulator
MAKTEKATKRDTIHIYLGRNDDEESAESVTARLDQIITQLDAVQAQGEKLIMASAELKATLAQIDEATTDIAADIDRLKAGVVVGMTEVEVAEVQAEATRLATKLRGIAADTENPVPA